MITIALGPWSGADNVHDVYSEIFQPSEERKARVTAAVNVNWTDDGWFDLRAGTTNRRTGTAYKTVVSCAGLLLAQDGGSIYTIDPDDSYAAVEVVSGLDVSAVVSFHEFNGDAYYTNGYVCGKILQAGTATHWGLTNPPSPTLDTAVGDLTAGRYLVACTLVDATGLESGAYESSAIIVNGSQDITVDLSAADANATHVNIYVSPVDQKGMFWNQKVTVGSLPATITDPRTLSSRPLKHQMLRSPIAADGVSSFLGYVFLWIDNVIFRSEGQVPHLFYPKTKLLTFPFNVQAVLGLQDGFYVITTKTLHWISGTKPEQWQNTQLARGEFAAGGCVCSSEQVPWLGLEREAMVALLASKDGLIVGLPGGQLRYETHDRLSITTAPTTASLVAIKQAAYRQIWMRLSYAASTSLHVMNARTSGISEYSDLSLLAIAEHGHQVFGVTATQLLEFTGSDDTSAAIAAYLQTGKISDGSMEETHYTRAYVKDQYANALLLTTLIDTVNAESEAVEKSVSYSIPSHVGARQHAHAERLRRDVKGTSWAWKLANVSGGGMSIRGFSVQPEGTGVDV